VCGDDRVTCYSGADNISSEPRDAYWRSEGSTYMGILQRLLLNFLVI